MKATSFRLPESTQTDLSALAKKLDLILSLEADHSQPRPMA
jgi:hypothetical protein